MVIGSSSLRIQTSSSVPLCVVRSAMNRHSVNCFFLLIPSSPNLALLRWPHYIIIMTRFPEFFSIQWLFNIIIHPFHLYLTLIWRDNWLAVGCNWDQDDGSECPCTRTDDPKHYSLDSAPFLAPPLSNSAPSPGASYRGRIRRQAQRERGRRPTVPPQLSIDLWSLIFIQTSAK